MCSGLGHLSEGSSFGGAGLLTKTHIGFVELDTLKISLFWTL